MEVLDIGHGLSMEPGHIDAVVGLQRGDEGKGRFVDMMTSDYSHVARFNGGPNAGHTVVTPEGREFKLHTVPSGIAHQDKVSVVGDGVFIDVIKFNGEIDYLIGEGLEVTPENLMISSSAHLILPHHVLGDEKRESGSKGQGSTKSGIAQVDSDFGLREGVRAEMIKNEPLELLEIIREGLIRVGPRWRRIAERIGIPLQKEMDVAQEYVLRASKLGKFITDTSIYLNEEMKKGNMILAEGAQAFLLDKYQGMWPNVTSSITTSGGISPGLGVPPQRIKNVLGVSKSIPSHVGGGHFVTEIHDTCEQQRLHGDLMAGDAETGTTTGRLRRLGHYDIPVIRRANMVNGTTEMAITKLDWLSRYGSYIPVCVNYERKGNIIPIAPNAEYKLQQSTPQFRCLPGWDDDISGVRNFSDLPTNAQRYVEFIEEQTGVPVTYIGVGQRRDQVIVRN